MFDNSFLMIVEEVEDPSLIVANRYYLHKGKGSPSDEGFNDLNEAGIRAFLELLGVENPLSNFYE